MRNVLNTAPGPFLRAIGRVAWKFSALFDSQHDNDLVFSYILSLTETKSRGTAANYSSAGRSFGEFIAQERAGCPPLRFGEITAELMERYERWLAAKGVRRNTISFYMRTLRAIYNSAVEASLTADRKPFGGVYTGIDKTIKRAVTEVDVRALIHADLRAHSELDAARNIFLLSFCLRGMSFVDMAFLKKSDYDGSTLSYCRKKTGQPMLVTVNAGIMRLMDRCMAGDGSPYLLNIITRPGAADEWQQYKNALRATNRALKEVARIAGIDVPLTTYVSRHTWASLAKEKGLPLLLISDALGHSNASTTQIYLASFDRPALDRANDVVCGHLSEEMAKASIF